MAKVRNCPFCGKEIKIGFLGIFGGDAKELEFGDVSSIYVCAECDQKHHQFAKEDRGRFAHKLENIKKATKTKFSNEDIATMFVNYREEAEIYKTNCKGQKATTYLGRFYDFNDNGFFWPLEAVNEIGSAGDYFTNNFIELNKNRSLKSNFGFTKNDISTIEYFVISDEEPKSEMDGLNSTRYSLVGIKLNDYTKMTYKPCFVKAVVISEYKGIFADKKKIEQDIIAQLEEFRDNIGATDIPIVKVKKF